MVVERYVGLYGRCEFAIGLEFTQIIHLHFQGALKTLDWAVVDTASDPGHAVGQSHVFHRALEPSLAMDHRTRSWMEPRDGWHHRMEHEPVVVGPPDTIGDDRAVIQVDDRAQICLLPVTVFELGYIGVPFLVQPGRTEFAVHQVLGHMLWHRLLMSLPLPADNRLDPMYMHQAIDSLFIEHGQTLLPA